MTRGAGGVVVRRLGPSDLADFRAIRLAALAGAPEAFGSVHAVEAQRPIERYAERLSGSLVFGAYDGARIVGMIGLAPEQGPKDAHKGLVWGFYVEPDSRGAGVGRVLLATLVKAAERRVEQVMLSVAIAQTAAIALYERAGFVRYGVEPRALKSEAGYVDEALMVLFLDQER